MGFAISCFRTVGFVAAVEACGSQSGVTQSHVFKPGFDLTLCLGLSAAQR